MGRSDRRVRGRIGALSGEEWAGRRIRWACVTSLSAAERRLEYPSRQPTRGPAPEGPGDANIAAGQHPEDASQQRAIASVNSNAAPTRGVLVLGRFVGITCGHIAMICVRDVRNVVGVTPIANGAE